MLHITNRINYFNTQLKAISLNLVLLNLLCSSQYLIASPVISQPFPHAQNDDNKSAVIDHSKHIQAINQGVGTPEAAQLGTINLPNVTLVNEQGKKNILFHELIKNKIVIMNTIFTTCTTVCPMMGYQFSRLQKTLQNQFGTKFFRENIIILSVSIDPAADTPQRLAAWKKRFNGNSGWTLLTGSQDNIEKLLKAAGLFSAAPEDHTPITLIGNARKDQWLRLSGLSSTKQLVQLVGDFFPSNNNNNNNNSNNSVSLKRVSY